MIITESERLIIREITIDDADFFFNLVNQPDWHRNIGDRNVRVLQDSINYINNKIRTAYKEFGFGMYVLEQKSDGELVGMCGLVARPELEEPDIGFALLPQHYKKGFAFESSEAILKLAKEKHQIKTLLAIVNPDNQPSIKLIEKLGFRYIDNIQLHEESGAIKKYAIDLC